MQSKKPSNKRLWILNHMLIILLQYEFESFELGMRYRFQHVFAVRSVVEETSRLTRAALLFEAHDVAHHHGAD